VTSVIFSALFGFINSAQQVYVSIYKLGVWFPVVFALVAGLMSIASFANSKLVLRIATEPLGHLAGTASSVQGLFQTVGAAVVGARIGQAFGGTVLPLALGFFIVGALQYLYSC
jgi:MFS transporter, DHA1 family, multidrug resistance protein